MRPRVFIKQVGIQEKRDRGFSSAAPRAPQRGSRTGDPTLSPLFSCGHFLPSLESGDKTPHSQRVAAPFGRLLRFESHATIRFEIRKIQKA